MLAGTKQGQEKRMHVQKARKMGRWLCLASNHEMPFVSARDLVFRCGAARVDASLAKPALPYIMRLMSFTLVTCPSSMPFEPTVNNT